MTQAVALHFDGGIMCRNVRPLESMLEEFSARNIEHVHVNPALIKFGSWDLVLVFKDKETREKYESGELEYTNTWQPGSRVEVQRINPLKAAKRASRRRG